MVDSLSGNKKINLEDVCLNPLQLLPDLLNGARVEGRQMEVRLNRN